MLVANGVILASAVILLDFCAQDWPQWRGPRRDGVAPESRLPRDWPKSAPKPLWRVTIGEGYSAPVVSQGRLCIMGRQGQQEIGFCFDADTGKEIWRHAYEQPFQTHPGAKSAGLGPKSTPTIDGNQVYMLGINGRFHCFDVKTGRHRWSHDFATEFWGVEKDTDGYDKWKPFCGMAASPLIDGENVIIPVGGKKGGRIAAFNRHNGKLNWKCLEDRSSYASPMAVELAGVTQIVAFTGKRMVGIGRADGKLLWEHPYDVPYDDTIITPVVWNDMVLVGGWENPTIALRINGENGELRPSVAWANKSLKTMNSTPVLGEAHIYGFANSGRILCVDMATGNTAWTSDNVGTYASLVAAGDQLLALSQAGELHVFELTPKAFTRRAKLVLSEVGESWAHLAVSGSRVYVKDKEHLMCFEFGR